MKIKVTSLFVLILIFLTNCNKKIYQTVQHKRFQLIIPHEFYECNIEFTNTSWKLTELKNGIILYNTNGNFSEFNNGAVIVVKIQKFSKHFESMEPITKTSVAKDLLHQETCEMYIDESGNLVYDSELGYVFIKK